MQPLWIAVLSLSVGQPGPPGVPPGPDAYPYPTGQPAGVVPAGAVPSVQPPAAADQPAPAPATVNVQAQLPTTTPPAATPPAPATPPDRWAVMHTLQGTWLGAGLDDNRMSISGWFEGSYTASSTNTTNQPVVWNDRPNTFLLQQAWLRVERSVVTSGTSTPTWGYRIDILSGSDYRFTQQRGLFNSQLENSNGNQNLYGVDPIQFYVNTYIPNLFEGTDVRAGRLYTPWGYESLEAISTPFASRSYAFNWSPPFTHMGIMISPQFNKQWSGKFMLANGNDVFFTANQEPRLVGALTWTSLSKADTATFGWSLGRGKFNAARPFAPATAGEQNEPAGRNNLNALDFVYTHTFNPRLAYSTELIYGWQYGVPANVPGGIIDEGRAVGEQGFAHWGSWVQYLTYNFTSRLTGIARFELFDDFEGQRTGFEGLYTAITVGAQIKPYKWLMFRPELRYDRNNYSNPFEGRNNIYTAAFDCIVRW
jgi:hypothetical protein